MMSKRFFLRRVALLSGLGVPTMGELASAQLRTDTTSMAAAVPLVAAQDYQLGVDAIIARLFSSSMAP
jgi:hypothetical protein